MNKPQRPSNIRDKAAFHGATIEQVQLLLGHESIDQTSRYIDVSLAEMARAMAAVI